ncbi:helix-turn-helix domain-containing protein [Streptomyces aureus]|uniref:helix-turn-helix domain-containing protein n=1 Tax=Streptomyces aureus TaxID=193461 RepID=UPI000A97A671|nr:helix-turn-helix domain-containing protein [Streptomyces aureus]
MAADTVRKWRRRFIADRLDGLADKPLSPQPAAMDAEGAGAALTTASAGSSDFSDLKKARRRIARLQAELAIHKRVAQLLGDAALSQERTTSSGC